MIDPRVPHEASPHDRLGAAGRPDVLSRRGGFTLIEMVVTIGIIILAAGFLAPAVGTMFQNRKLENAGTLISNVLNEARNSAVTKKQIHHVVFLRNGLRIYAEPKGKDPGGFKGRVYPYDPDSSGTISYTLNFARKDFDEIPEDLQVVLRDRESPPPEEEWEITPDDITIRFQPDGTVDFGSNEDIPSYLFNETPPEDADIVIQRVGDQYRRGFVDIRPTGRSVFKVEEIEE